MILGFFIIIAILVGSLLSLLFLFEREKLIKQFKESSGDSEFFHRQYNEILSDVAEMIEERVAKQKFELERKNAVLIQKTLNTHFYTQLQGITVWGKIISADECSGDWWYSYEKNGKLYVWVGDVTGHGVSAAIVASACRSLVMSFEKGAFPSLTEQVGTLNDVLVSMFKRTSFVTFKAIAIDLESLDCEIVNGSHPDIFVRSPNGVDGIGGEPNPPLGMWGGHRYKSVRLSLSKKFDIYLMTDGLLEIVPRKGRWSYKIQKRFFGSLSGDLSSAEQVENICQKAESLRGGLNNLPDDITVVVISCRKENAAGEKAAA